MPDAAILVMTSLPDRDAALALSSVLVTGRLAACVTIGASIESMYHWRGQIETGHEVPIVIKTREALYARVEAAIVAAHPYELPEVVAIPITYGLERYLQWIDDETRQH